MWTGDAPPFLVDFVRRTIFEYARLFNTFEVGHGIYMMWRSMRSLSPRGIACDRRISAVPERHVRAGIDEYVCASGGTAPSTARTSGARFRHTAALTVRRAAVTPPVVMPGQQPPDALGGALPPDADT